MRVKKTYLAPISETVQFHPATLLCGSGGASEETFSAYDEKGSGEILTEKKSDIWSGNCFDE